MNVAHRSAGHLKKAPLALHLLEQLELLGVQEVFYVPGAQIDGLMRVALEYRRLRIYMAAHEAGAAYMADGACRSSSKPSVVMSIGGPGAGNLITAAMTAAADRVPVIFITGDVPTFLQGMEAFQHAGPDGSVVRCMFEAAGCHSFRISHPSDLIMAFRSFKRDLDSGRSKPMHLSIPCDLALTDMPGPDAAIDIDVHTEQTPFYLFEKKSSRPQPDHRLISKAALWLGVDISPAATDHWLSIARKFLIPVATSIESVGLLARVPEPLRLGIFGHAGHPAAHQTLLDPELELLIIHGVSFNERNTACWDPFIWHPNRDVLVVQNDSEIPWPAPLDLTCSRHISDTASLESIIDQETGLIKKVNKTLSVTQMDISVIRNRYVNSHTSSNDGQMNFSLFSVLHHLSEKIQSDMPVFMDAGDHRYFTAHIFSRIPHQLLFGAHHTAPMGWAIGAGIGAALNTKHKRHLVITGDGCMLMHGMEAATAVRYQAPVTFVLIDNGSYGKVLRRFSDMNVMSEDLPGTLPAIDWPMLCRSFSLPCVTVNDMDGLIHAWSDSLQTSGPFMIIVRLSPDEPYPYPASVFSSASQSFILTCQENIKSTGWPIRNIHS